MESGSNIFRRSLLLIAGIFIIGIGVALSIRSDLGITPITCPPLVFSLRFPAITVGQFTIMMHFLFVGIQIALLRKNFEKKQLIQLVLAFLFGYFIDFGMLITQTLIPTNYLQQLLLMVAGVIVTAIGVVMEVRANLIFIAGEGLMMAISQVTRHPYDRVKIWVDCSLLVIAIVFSLWFFQRIEGIREGTIINALGVGWVMIVINKLFPEKEVQ